VPDQLTVAAPASSANLGPGFDCLAVALELRNDVVLTARDDDRLVVTVEGEGANEASTGPDNLFLRAFAAAGGNPIGLDVHMLNTVPFARGLGSSAATIAAGLTAGAAWSGADGLDLLAMATVLEGHPDNVAAALNGGLTLAWQGDGGPRAVGFEPPPVGFVAVIGMRRWKRPPRGPPCRRRCRMPTRYTRRRGPRCWWPRWERATPT